MVDDSHRVPFAKNVQAAFLFVYFWCCFRFHIFFSKSVIYSSLINFVDIGNKLMVLFSGKGKKAQEGFFFFFLRMLLLGYSH